MPGQRVHARPFAALIGLLLGTALLVVLRSTALATASPIPPASPGHAPAVTAEPPYLTLAIDDGLAPGIDARPGQAITYTFAISNPTNTAVTNVRLIALVPAHTQPTTTTLQSWTCATVPTTNDLRCENSMLGLASQSAAALALQVRLDDPLPAETTMIELLAVVTADEIVCGECGQATLQTPVDPSATILPAERRLFLPLLCAPQP